MDAQIALIPDMFNYSTLMEIPFFQRGYVWDEDLWGRFLEDMEFIVKSRKPHFFGSLILKTGRERTEDDQFSVCRTVIDGQQRLTTLVIFMKVLCLKKNENSYFVLERAGPVSSFVPERLNKRLLEEVLMRIRDSLTILWFVKDKK